MTEQNRTLVLAYLLMGLLIASQCVNSHGFVILESAESREAQLGRRFMLVDTVSRFSLLFTFNSWQNLIVFCLQFEIRWRAKNRREIANGRILRGRTQLGIDTHRRSKAETMGNLSVGYTAEGVGLEFFVEFNQLENLSKFSFVKMKNVEFHGVYIWILAMVLKCFSSALDLITYLNFGYIVKTKSSGIFRVKLLYLNIF